MPIRFQCILFQTHAFQIVKYFIRQNGNHIQFLFRLIQRPHFIDEYIEFIKNQFEVRIILIDELLQFEFACRQRSEGEGPFQGIEHNDQSLYQGRRVLDDREGHTGLDLPKRVSLEQLIRTQAFTIIKKADQF